MILSNKKYILKREIGEFTFPYEEFIDINGYFKIYITFRKGLKYISKKLF